MSSSSHKILSRERLQATLASWREEGLHIVFTNGCFDLLHPGHIDNMEMAKSFGDRLIVGLNADNSVRRLKGPSRPVNDEQVRARMLAALGCVDAVCLFEEDTPSHLIKLIKPHILVKGGDYQPHEVVGHEIVAEYGGEVRIIPLTKGYSSTNLIERLKSIK